MKWGGQVLHQCLVVVVEADNELLVMEAVRVHRLLDMALEVVEQVPNNQTRVTQLVLLVVALVQQVLLS
jgi:hypothetical protein